MTLELSNVATLPIKLWPGMKIGQLCLFRTSSPAEHPYGSAVYGSRYQDQRGPDAVPVLPEFLPLADLGSRSRRRIRTRAFPSSGFCLSVLLPPGKTGK